MGEWRKESGRIQYKKEIRGSRRGERKKRREDERQENREKG